MADKSKIEWTDATWNPITGCTLVDEGCRHCYAAHLITNWPAIGNHPSRKGLARRNAAGQSKFTGEVRFNRQWLDQPLHWRTPRRIFVCAHGDLFHDSVPDDWIDQVFAVMALAPQHTFQVLTKRPERAAKYLSADWAALARFEVEGLVLPTISKAAGDAQDMLRRYTAPAIPAPLPNVWLGTSISDQASAELRIPHLLTCPAAVRFVSAEPLLAPLNLTKLDMLNIFRVLRAVDDQTWPRNSYDALRGRSDIHPIHGAEPDWGKLHWIICGGESGPHARPMHPDWARSLRDQCQEAGVAFHFKQWGEWAPVVIEQNDAGELTPAYPITGCSNPAAHNGGQRALFWQGEDLVEWPYIKTRQAIGGRRIGKKAAGRLLDGREWNEVPQ